MTKKNHSQGFRRARCTSGRTGRLNFFVSMIWREGPRRGVLTTVELISFLRIVGTPGEDLPNVSVFCCSNSDGQRSGYAVYHVKTFLKDSFTQTYGSWCTLFPTCCCCERSRTTTTKTRKGRHQRWCKPSLKGFSIRVKDQRG